MDVPDLFFDDIKTNSQGQVKLSHLNHKSSVLCPKSQDVTSQYMALQQLEAHQQMIARAKSQVDTSAPKSLQSYLSVADKQRKKSWSRQSSQSKESLVDYMNQNTVHKTSRLHANSSEEDNLSQNASTTKAVQTGSTLLPTFSCMTDDKIAWYLEALNQGELQHSSIRPTETSNQSGVTRKTKKLVKGDLMDWNKNAFQQPKKQFSPRILANSDSKSKVKEMRCYNPPFRRKIKRSASSHSSDTFESYDNETDDNQTKDDGEVEDFDSHKSSASSSVEEEILPVQKTHKQKHKTLKQDYHGSSQLSYMSQPQFNGRLYQARNDEDKYLEFLNKVTEDILRSGIYSDRAIQQTFEFHMQFYQHDKEKEELQSLLGQILENLKLTDEDPIESSYRNSALFDTSRPDSPPEKETTENYTLPDEISRNEVNSSADFRQQNSSLNLDFLESRAQVPATSINIDNVS